MTFDPDTKIETHRKRLYLQKPISEPTIIPKKHQIQAPPDCVAILHLYRNTPQKKTANGIPTIILVPGTACVGEHPGFRNAICSKIAMHSGAQVIALSHRLAPEHPFPIPLMDIRLGFEYILFLVQTKDPRFKIDPNNIGATAYCSGANLLLPTLIQTLKYSNLSLKYVMFISGLFDFYRPTTYPSQYTNNKGRFLSIPFFMWFCKQYFPKNNELDLKNPLLSPIYWSDQSLKALTKHVDKLILICGTKDFFLHDSTSFFKKLISGKNHNVYLKFFKGDHAHFWREPGALLHLARVSKTLFGLTPVLRTDLLETQRISIQIANSFFKNFFMKMSKQSAKQKKFPLGIGKKIAYILSRLLSGIFYEQGWGTKKNLDRAKACYWDAIKASSLVKALPPSIRFPKHFVQIVFSYFDTIPMKILSSAFQDKGSIGCWVGLCYLYGVGPKQNCAKAIRFFRESKKQKNPLAQFIFGECYEHGRASLPPNEKKMLRYYALSAKQNNAKALYKMAQFHYKKTIPHNSSAKMFHFLKRSADCGYLKAQLETAICYKKGVGTKVNLKKSYKYCKKITDNSSDNSEDVFKKTKKLIHELDRKSQKRKITE